MYNILVTLLIKIIIWDLFGILKLIKNKIKYLLKINNIHIREIKLWHFKAQAAV